MIDTLSRLLRLEPRETRHGLGLGVILFALTGGYTLTKTARDAVFLERLPATDLPWVFLVVGVLTTVLAAGWSRVIRGRSAARALELGAWLSTLGLIGFALLVPVGGRWLPLAFYLWVNAFGLILLAQFWTYANSVADPREAKRTVGLIGTFGILGGLIGGALASGISMLGGVSPIIAGAAALSALVPVLVRGTRHDRAFEEEPVVAGDPGAVASPWKLPYVRWLALASLCSVLVTTILDYQFKIAIQQRDHSAQAIATFMGGFYTATNLAALAMQVVVTRWALTTLGAGWSSAVLPAGLGLGAGLTAVVGGFPAVVATRLWDQVMRLSINRSATQLFFYPLPPEIRQRVKATIDAGLERLGDALAGLLLLALGAAMGREPRALAVAVLALVTVWLVAWAAVRRGYVVQLGLNVRRMNPAAPDLQESLRESSMLEAMTRLLDHPSDTAVLQGIELLEAHAPERVDARLSVLLGHASARVRARAAEWVGTHHRAELGERVIALLDDADPEVRLNAMRARLVLTGDNPLDALQEFLASEDPHLRRAALDCIAVLAPPTDATRLRALFDRVLRDGGEGAHEMVAEAIGLRTSDMLLHELLGPLLRSRSAPVRAAALESAGKLGMRSAVPALTDALAVRSTQAAAARGLAAFGDRIVGTLGDHLVDVTVPIEVRREIPRVLATIGTEAAVAALLRYRAREDVRLGYRVLKALNKIRSRDPRLTFPRSQVVEDVDHDVRSYLFALVHYRSCPIGAARSAERLLCIALNERMEQALNRIFRRLALIYPAASLYAAYRGVTSPDPRMRGTALEYLENALSPEHAALVLLLVGDSGEEARLHLAETRYGLRWRGVLESLDDILRGEDLWLRTLALYVVAVRGERSLRARIEDNLTSPDAVLRETARWALGLVPVE